MSTQGPYSSVRRHLGPFTFLAALVVLPVALAACGGSSQSPTTTRARSCSTSSLPGAVKASIPGVPPSDYTVTNIRTAASDPTWAYFKVVATSSAPPTFQNAASTAHCQADAWVVAPLGNAFIGCSTVPSQIRVQLGLQTDAQCAASQPSPPSTSGGTPAVPSNPSGGDPVAPHSFSSPSALASFLVAKGIACDGYHDTTHDPSSPASAEGQCASNGNTISLSIFSDTAHRNTWVSGERSFGASACQQATGNTTTTFVLGTNWVLVVNELQNPSGDPLTSQIATAVGTSPAKFCQ